jgi:hypothetical protein
MTKESLQSIPLQELVALAQEEGYEEGGVADRAALTEFILENLKERAREKEEENNPSVQVEESKYQITEPEAAGQPGPDIFPVADRYNQTRIVFMVRDPHWAYAYWDLENKWSDKLPIKGQSHYLVLRVRELNDADPADCGGKTSFDIPIQLGDSSWYIYLPNQDCRYLLELGVVLKGKYTCLARSNRIRTPRQCGVDTGIAELELVSHYSTYYLDGNSEAIPQRILAAGGD